MMDHEDFEEIKTLLEKSCDNCLLTRRHCVTCRIEKLRGVVGQFSKSGPYEILLINVNELKVLLNLAGESNKSGGSENEVINKWRLILGEIAGKEIMA